MSPFEALYGHKPCYFGLSSSAACATPDLDTWLQEKQLMQALIQQQLGRAQQRMKYQADKNRSERSFEVGDEVFLKLQPYVQSSLAPRSNQKLAYKFFGPFPVIAKIGKVAYKLQLPAHAQLHPVFHVSQLKKAVSSALAPAAIPINLDGFQVPEKILGRRLHPDGLKLTAQVLVKWSGMDDSLATWENVESLCQQFPHAPALEQAGCYRRGSVSNPEEQPASSSNGPRRSKRAAQPNRRFINNEWA